MRFTVRWSWLLTTDNVELRNPYCSNPKMEARLARSRKFRLSKQASSTRVEPGEPLVMTVSELIFNDPSINGKARTARLTSLPHHS